MSKEQFDKLLLEAIDEGLSTIGDSSKQAIYFYLEKSFKVKKNEIPYRIDDFTRAIEKIFGLGAGFLEILIMRNLYEKVGRTVHLREPSSFVFAEYIVATERSFTGKEEGEAGFIQCDQIISQV